MGPEQVYCSGQLQAQVSSPRALTKIRTASRAATGTESSRKNTRELISKEVTLTAPTPTIPQPPSQVHKENENTYYSNKKLRIHKDNNIKHLILKFENTVDVPGKHDTIYNIQLPRAKASSVSMTLPPTQTPHHKQNNNPTTNKSPHTNTITKSQLLHIREHINKHTTNTPNNINITTANISNHLIQRYNNIKFNKKHIHTKNLSKFQHSIPNSAYEGVHWQRLPMKTNLGVRDLP